MDNFQLISSILVVHFFTWLTPGPQITLIIRNSLIHSRKTAIFTALGFAIGNVIHIAYSFAGIAFLISQIPIAFYLIKFLGVGYLLYLGIKTFLVRARVSKQHDEFKQQDISAISAVRLGLLTNLLNPSASIFFASTYSGAIATGAATWALFFLMMAMPLNTLFMATVWSLCFSLLIVRVSYEKHQLIFNKCLGVALILFALKVVFTK
jgi:threonine/homoserine/homoserine lactone efflux protein